jgi:hypothetical protein
VIKNLSREKMLAIALVAVIVLWKGQSVVQSVLFEPVTGRQDQRDQLASEVEKQNAEKRRLRETAVRIKKWNERSLPPDPTIAQALYQSWLIEEATKAKLTGVSVEAMRADRLTGDTYYKIAATVKAHGTLDRVVDFLHAFNQSGFLHRVAGISMETARHEGNPPLDVVINVEALSLVASPSRTTLEAKPDATLEPGTPLKPRPEYDAVTKGNLFVRTYNGPPKPPPPEKKTTSPVEQLPDTAEHVYLVASLSSGEMSDAWLYDRTTNERTILTQGSEFKVAGISGKVLAISETFVVLEIEGESFRLQLGEHLRQLRKVPKVESAQQSS